MLRLTPQDLERTAIATLARVTGLPVEAVQQEVVGFHTHDWQADKLAGGAYRHVATGGLGAAAATAEPLEDALFLRESTRM